ncbi:DUF2278 family protein [Caulobacter hibisci]|uniref:DUF2278 family protein n=1 Tax=Caulobacter hibisci TaxID=2035993 RepID=A0ABS0T4Z1_9CAUL|nr:DUF2278 family protein [Caulobacter hibisci]
MLKGRPTANRLGASRSPHYQIQVSADGEQHRIAINVRSSDGSEVQFLVRAPFEHPVTEGLKALEQGLHPLQSRPGGLAIDFIRSNVGQPWEFKPLPIDAAGPDNDLNEKIDAYVQRAMADETAMIYAFGETWGPEPKADGYFGFKPGRSIHDIHFNQGNPAGRFEASNGPWQDGCLVFEFPNEKLWVGIFLKFQTQAWHSDDITGAPAAPVDPDFPGQPHTPVERDVLPNADVPDGLVRIVAALVNDKADPERESVTLLNTSDLAVSLEGWRLLDAQKQATALNGEIGPGDTLKIAVVKPMVLGNKGGQITLVDAKGLKVHGVAYTRDQVRQPGRTLPFQR